MRDTADRLPAVVVLGGRSRNLSMQLITLLQGMAVRARQVEEVGGQESSGGRTR